MIITPVVSGPFATDTYIVQTDRECILVDAPYPAETITGKLDAMGLRPSLILLTHAHFDHVLALPDLKERYKGARIAVSAADAAYLTDGGAMIRRDISLFDAEYYFDITKTYNLPSPDILLEDGDEPYEGIKVIATPGHTKGSICFYDETEKVLFSGDTLFCHSVGRTDMEGGDMTKLIASLRRLMTLPGDVLVLPGHGQSTTIGEEKESNPYIRGF